MTTRELWNQIMNYGEFDQIPAFHWGCWQETRERWVKEGLVDGTDEYAFFGAKGLPYSLQCDLSLLPASQLTE